jgi:uridine kinase
LKEILVTLPSGARLSFPFGVKASELAARLPPSPVPLAALLVNNETTAFDASVIVDCAIAPLAIDDSRGAFVYRKSLCFLLALAARELYPDHRLVAGMAIGNGFYHFFEDERLEAVIRDGRYLAATRDVLQRHGGLWFQNESFVISRHRFAA